MEIKKKVKELFGEEEPPTFSDFDEDQIIEMIAFWEAKIEQHMKEMHEVLNQIDCNEDDSKKFIYNDYCEKYKQIQKEHEQRREDAKRVAEEDTKEWKRLVMSLRKRLKYGR